MFRCAERIRYACGRRLHLIRRLRRHLPLGGEGFLSCCRKRRDYNTAWRQTERCGHRSLRGVRYESGSAVQDRRAILQSPLRGVRCISGCGARRVGAAHDVKHRRGGACPARIRSARRLGCGRGKPLPSGAVFAAKRNRSSAARVGHDAHIVPPPAGGISIREANGKAAAFRRKRLPALVMLPWLRCYGICRIFHNL